MKTLKEKVIAVAGVSIDESKYGNKVFKSLAGEGYNVIGVNPKGGEIMGKKIYESISAAPVRPDVVITVVQPSVTEKIVEECIKLGVKEIWMQPGSESEKAIETAKDNGISVTHHSCIMVNNGIW